MNDSIATTIQNKPGTKLGCDYQGHEFGAADYPDSVCVDGYLWDADSSEDDGLLHCGGDIPCPKCNAQEHAEYYADEDAA